MIIRREALNAVLPATTADDTRYFLHALLAEPANHRVIATNGHVMLFATDNEPQADADFPTVPGAEFHGDPAPICIDADIARSMIAAMPKRPTINILASAQLSQNGSEETATIAATNLSAPCTATIKRQEADQFPNYERVIPKADRAVVRVALGVPVLEALIKSAKAVCAKDKGVITFEIPTEARDVVSVCSLTIKGETVTVTGLAMPCRL